MWFIWMCVFFSLVTIWMLGVPVALFKWRKYGREDRFAYILLSLMWPVIVIGEAGDKWAERKK